DGIRRFRVGTVGLSPGRLSEPRPWPDMGYVKRPANERSVVAGTLASNSSVRRWAFLAAVFRCKKEAGNAPWRRLIRPRDQALCDGILNPAPPALRGCIPRSSPARDFGELRRLTGPPVDSGQWPSGPAPFPAPCATCAASSSARAAQELNDDHDR